MLLETKVAAFKEAVAKNLHYQGEIPVCSPLEDHYRLRAEFGIYHQNEPEYSLHHIVWEKKTKKYIFIDQGFLLACPLINDLIPHINSFMSSPENYEFAYKLFQVEYLTTMSGEALVTLIFHRKLRETDQERAEALQQYLASLNLCAKISVIVRARKASFTIGENFICENFRVNGIDHKLLEVENSFSQPNGLVNQEMLAFVDKHCHTEKDILELYCGVGNFSVILARCGRRVLCTEVNKQAVEFVKRNLALNNIDNVDVGRISAEEFTQAMNKVRPFKRLAHLDLDSYEFETVFVDPPRSGLDEDSLDMISAYKNIIYVSCNPQTLISNLEYLTKEKGYKIDKLALFDQFPHTEHLESIALLSKVNID